MFCVECGKEDKVYDGLCSECFLKKKQLVHLPEILDVQLCGQCYAAKIGKHWKDALNLEEAVHLALEESLVKDKNVNVVKLNEELRELDPRNYTAHVEVFFKAGELDACKEFDVKVRLKKDTCQRCGKKSGHYYEAILQIRGSGKNFGKEKLTKAREYFLQRMQKITSENREAFVSKEEVIHGGFDFYLSSSSVAKSLAREMSKKYGAQVKATYSIAGMKDGRELTRMTYLVRLPEYEPGDILQIEGKYHLLKGFEGNNLFLIDLENWHESSISVSRLSEIEVLDRKSHTFSVSVVSENEKEVQVLDPETMSPVEIKKPVGYPKKQATATIVRTKKGLLLVP